jgi:predicted dehydrogenase
VSRREFLLKSALTGAGLILAPAALRAQKEAAASDRSSDALNIAIVGCGIQGLILLDSLLLIPGVRIQAICDIRDYCQTQGRERLDKGGRAGETRYYTDFEDFLDKERSRDLHAVIIATPDVCHAPQTNACLKAGLHVYCEKVMSNTVEGARSMVRTMRETGKLLQIGHQRRSNPRYEFTINQLVKNARIPGRLTALRAQWNHLSGSGPVVCPKGTEVPVDTLRRYGYPSMEHLLVWRRYRNYAGGPICDLGAHQMDILNWVIGVRPTKLTAVGGRDYVKNSEQLDNVIAIYDYPTSEGMVRAMCEVISTSSAGGGGFAKFMGEEGTIILSETPRLTKAYREHIAPSWDQWVEKKLLVRKGGTPREADDRIDVRETMALDEFGIPVVLTKTIYQPHLENFFDAIRGKATLNFDGARALESEGVIFPVNAAVAEGKPYIFSPSDFEA